jgi:hypothetical protein
MQYGSARLFLQAYSGTFPTMCKLHQYGQVESPDCPFCPGTPEHMVHWQCLCPQHRLSRTAAHNRIWQVLGGRILQHAAPHWTIKLEMAMGDSGLRHSGTYSNWRPDGMAYDPKTKTLYFLELTRCSDARDSALLEAVERKVVKYDELAKDVALHNPHITVRQLTFAIGYLGTTDDIGLRASLLTLGIDDAHATPIIKATVTATIAAFGKMGRERWASLLELKRTTRTAARQAMTARRRRPD